MVAIRPTPPFKAIMVASLEYIAAHGEPVTLADLSTHNCVGFRLLGSGSCYDWDKTDGDRQVAVRTTGTAVITDATFASELAIEGIGIAYNVEPLVRTDLCEEHLQWLLSETSLQEDGFLFTSRGMPRLRRSCAPSLMHLVDRGIDKRRDLALAEIGWRWLM